MSKVVFEYRNGDIKIEVDRIGRHETEWDAINSARDKLEAEGLHMEAFCGKVTWTSEL